MSSPTTHDVTRLLLAWNSGDAGASEQLMPLVYDELRQLARSYLRREHDGHTLQPTALVHEAYLRLVDATQINWQGRIHFYGIAARLMRRVLVDHARARLAVKRGGQVTRVSLDEAGDILRDEGVHLVALDDALQALTQLYPRQSQVVELRFFGGLNTREIAEVSQVSESTVERDWHFALLWLKREMTTDENSAEPPWNCSVSARETTSSPATRWENTASFPCWAAVAWAKCTWRMTPCMAGRWPSNSSARDVPKKRAYGTSATSGRFSPASTIRTSPVSTTAG